MNNPTLIPYQVTLIEAGMDQAIAFECSAEGDEHALEQAENAYPGCKVQSCSPIQEDKFVIYSPNESALSSGAGFWCNTDGWVDLPSATVFLAAEREMISLPLSTGSDARYVALEEANKQYSEAFALAPSSQVTLRLTLDVTYRLNGETVDEMVARLQKLCEQAIGNGMLTGESEAEVDEYSMEAKIQPEPLTEHELANFMLHRIESGEWSLKDISVRLARFGLMEPNAFVDEMRERIELTEAET